MNQFTKDIVAALANKQDLDTIFKNHLQTAINELLQNELSAYLGYERYSRNGFNSGNSRNGSYLRSFKTKYGELQLTIPRDRNDEFADYTLPAYQRGLRSLSKC